MVVEHGGLFPFTKAFARGEVKLPPPDTAPRPMTIAEKVLAAHVVGATGPVYVKPGDAVSVRVDGGYSHEFTTAQVHYFLEQEYGPDYRLHNPAKFAVFEDHLIYADGVAKMAPFSPKIQVLRDMQRVFQEKTGVQDYSARDGVSPGICHTRGPRAAHRARRLHPGHGQPHLHGRREQRARLRRGRDGVRGARALRLHVRRGARVHPVRADRPPGQRTSTAKDVMLFILAEYAKKQMTLDRVMEFGGPGLGRCPPTSARPSPTWRRSARPRRA